LPSPFRRPSGARPRVLGHRGARHGAPENTLKAFELAASEGADGVELDVRRCASGEVIVLHDPTLSRVTGGRDGRHVETLPWTELSRIDVGRGERVPLLEQVLDWALGLNMLVNVEVKSDVRARAALLAAVTALLQAHLAAQDNVLLSSFDPRFVRFFSRRLPEVTVGWLVHARQHLLRGAPAHRWLGASAVHPEHVLARPNNVARWKAAGSLVVVWTVNDVSRARALADIGVDAIISDVPGKILQGLVAGK
jgi:glycerophosphoryl diester phosphodiesterase